MSYLLFDFSTAFDAVQS